MSRIRLLTFSSLYPNASMPRHGLFVEQRLRHLLASGEAESRVIAPVPWFPLRHRAFGAYARFAGVPQREKRHGIAVSHPRFVRIPKLGMSTAPSSMAAGTLGTLRKTIADGYDFDLIDAHYFFPDGVAAVKLAKRLRKPVLITARGTDLSLIPQFARPRSMIQWAAENADGLITVCAALKETLVELGVDGNKVTVLRNGVDLDLFRPADRMEVRRKLSLPEDRKILLSVGLLIDRKGHDIPIRALAQLPKLHLMIAGDGEKEQALRQLAVETGVADRVRFLGGIPHEKLRDYYNAADALVLASSREGWANVLLESMACGTPVVASNVWGTPEVVADAAAGVLMAERTPPALVAAWETLMAHYPEREATRAYAGRFSWDETTAGQLALMRRVIDKAGSRR